MQRTPRSATAREQKKPMPRSKKLANMGLAGMGVCIVAGAVVVAQQGQAAEVSNAEAARDYTPAVTYTPPPTPTDVAFLGDSYTQGTGASVRFNRWSTLVSQENGWLELNYGVGGTNFVMPDQDEAGRAYTERLTDLIASDPDVVVVSSAGNALNLDQAPGINETFQELREGLPDARIVALSPFRWAGEYPEEVKAFGEEMREGVEAVGGEYVDIGHPLGDRPEAISKDGQHPNDLGYEMLAEAVGDALG